MDEYLKIASDSTFGRNRQMIILLLDKLKAESAVLTLISLLNDEEVRLQAICALGDFKSEDFAVTSKISKFGERRLAQVFESGAKES